MAFSSLTDQLALLGWSSSVALPGDVKRLTDAAQSEAWPCACRKPHPCRLSGMETLVDDSPEMILPG
jgi:hypothetical protein